MLGRYGGTQLVATAYREKKQDNFGEKAKDVVGSITVDDKKETPTDTGNTS